MTSLETVTALTIVSVALWTLSQIRLLGLRNPLPMSVVEMEHVTGGERHWIAIECTGLFCNALCSPNLCTKSQYMQNLQSTNSAQLVLHMRCNKHLVELSTN